MRHPKLGDAKIQNIVYQQVIKCMFFEWRSQEVGKTYILKEFGKQEYDNVAYINCDGNSEIADIFAENYDMSRVLMILSAITIFLYQSSIIG